MSAGAQCLAPNCGFFGSTYGYCSQCWKDRDSIVQHKIRSAREARENAQVELVTLQSQIEANPELGGVLEERVIEVMMTMTQAEADEAAAEKEAAELKKPVAGGGGAWGAGEGTMGAAAEIEEALRRSMQEDTLPDVRRFSASAPELAETIRSLLRDTCLTSDTVGVRYVAETPPVMVVPAFAEPAMQELVDKLLIDDYVTRNCDANGVLNWQRDATGASRCVVLHTLGDGNCLCHSASLLLWRLHDRDTLLRACIAGTLMPAEPTPVTDDLVANLQARFFAERVRADMAIGINPPSHAALVSQWDEQLGLVMTDHTASRRAGYLTELHAFVLANVLRRPILLFGDHDALIAGMVGVYLPLLWADPAAVSKAPLVVLFNGSHFSAVTTVQNTTEAGLRSIHLATKAGPLPVRFLTDDEDADTVAADWMHVVGSTADGARVVALDPPDDPLVVAHPPPSDDLAIRDLVDTLQRQFFVTMRDESATTSATPIAAATPRDGSASFAFP